MVDLTTAIKIATELHHGQTDKSGQPYILHPLRVMLAMDDDLHRIVAVLHDVPEDCEDGWQALHDAGFRDEILDAIDLLTRKQEETYDRFILMCSTNPIARRVKIADIQDNLRPGAPHLEERYRKALRFLMEDSRSALSKETGDG